MRWRFLLADSDDLRITLGELRMARQKSVTMTLNRPGSCSFSYPMDAELAEFIEPLRTAVLAYRYSTKLGSWQLKWSGPVWTIDESVHDNSMQIACVGWLELLNKRLLRQNLNYSSIDDSVIIQGLLAEANLTTWTNPPHDMAFTVPVPAGSYPNTPTRISYGGTISSGPLTDIAYTLATRNKAYQRFQNIGAAILELTELENGVDISIDPLTRALYTYRKRQRVQTEVVFGYNWGPSNIQQFTRQFDSSVIANHMLVTGKAGTTPGVAHTSGWASGTHGWPGDTSPNTLLDYGLFEEVVSLPEVHDSTVLATYASAEIFFRYRPRIIYSITPFVFTPNGSVPEPLEDYDLGDSVYLTAKAPPRVSIQNQQVRVFGFSFSIDEEGNERVGALQTAPG